MESSEVTWIQIIKIKIDLLAELRKTIIGV